MKTIAKTTIVIAGAAVCALSTLLAMPATPKKHGTDILHLSISKPMHDEGVETNASGKVELKRNQQGNADNQRLDLALRGLAPGGTYQLTALVDDDTNRVQVIDFDTDARGKASLHFQKTGNGHGRGMGMGRGKTPLPGALDPVSDIRELAVLNGRTQAVLTADLTDPDRLQYLVKRDLSSGGVDALLRIKATTRQTQFRLTASGLNPTNDYLLVLNGVIVQTNSTDASGGLNIFSLVQNPEDILALQTVALWDSSSNAVVSTHLP